MGAFNIQTLGCKVNRVESEKLAAALMDAGWVPAAVEDADVAIVATCTVTAEADSKTRQRIRQVVRKMEGPVVVCGCAVNIAADEYAQIDERVICEPDKTKIPALLASLELPAREEEPESLEDVFRTRTGVMVQDGCDNACTYCIVHKARGAARSFALAEIVEEVRGLVAAGKQEIVLTGIDIGAWREGELGLPDLLRTLLEETEIARIRLSSVEPHSVTDELIALMAEADGRICRHLHLPLQSGSNAVLKAMGRRYTAEDFFALVEKLRAAMPTIALSTDVIVGFPGESEADFNATLNFCRKCAFMKMHIFRYSKRPGTPAARMNAQVLPQVASRRSARLTALANQMAAADRKARVGTTELVLAETETSGTSESYHTVALEAATPGTLVPITL